MSESAGTAKAVVSISVPSRHVALLDSPQIHAALACICRADL